MGYVTKKLGIRSQKARRAYVERKIGMVPGRTTRTRGFWMAVGLMCVLVLVVALVVLGLVVQ